MTTVTKKEVSRRVSVLTHEIGAYKINRTRPFIFNSRIISPDYVDCRRYIWIPDARRMVTAYMAEEVRGLQSNRKKNYDFIAGMEAADIPFASWVAESINLPMVFVRKEAKGHGQERRIVGAYESELNGKHGIHIGDLSTKATAAKELASQIRADGAELDSHVVIMDRDQGAKEGLAMLVPPIELRYLTLMDDDFYDIGIKANRITKEDFEAVKKYRAGPKKWAHEFLRGNPEFIRESLRPHVKDGKIKKRDALEVLTVGYPELKEELKYSVQDGLKQLQVRERVPEFEYAG